MPPETALAQQVGVEGPDLAHIPHHPPGGCATACGCWVFAGVNIDSVGDECKVSCETLNKVEPLMGEESDVIDDVLFLLDILLPPAVTIL